MPVSLTGDQIVIAKLERLIANTGPDSAALRAALGKVGTVIASLAMRNIQAQSIIDQGTLFNSIKWQFTDGSKTGIQVGSFGVVYAAMNEFGGPVSPAMRRAMFAAMRRRGKMQPGAASKAKANSKGVIQNNFWRARPYLRPAFDQSVDYVVDTIADAIMAAK